MLTFVGCNKQPTVLPTNASAVIQSGDIIIAVNSRRVSSIRQLRAELAKVGRRVAVLLQRGGSMIFIPLKFRDD